MEFEAVFVLGSWKRSSSLCMWLFETPIQCIQHHATLRTDFIWYHKQYLSLGLWKSWVTTQPGGSFNANLHEIANNICIAQAIWSLNSSPLGLAHLCPSFPPDHLQVEISQAVGPWRRNQEEAAEDILCCQGRVSEVGQRCLEWSASILRQLYSI